MKSLASVAVIAAGVAVLAAPRIAAAAYTYEVVADIPANDPYAVAVDPSLHQIYAVNENTLEVIDETTDSVLAQVVLGGFLERVVVDPTTHAVFISASESGRVIVFDGATLQVVTEVTVGNNPQEMVVDPSTHSVYVGDDDGVTVIDGVAHVVTGTIPHVFGAMAIDPTTHTLYVAYGTDHQLWVIDGSTNAVVATPPIGDPDLLIAELVAVDPVLQVIYVGNDQPVRTVSVLDAVTYALIATVPVGTGMAGMVCDPTTHTLYIAGEPNVGIVMFDGKTNTVVETIPDSDADAIGVDSSTSAAFVATSPGSGDIWKILPFCTSVGCAHPQIIRLGEAVFRAQVGHGLGLPLLVADVAQSTGHQLIACRAMGAFVFGTERGDGTFLDDVVATDWINQARAIEAGMGCP